MKLTVDTSVIIAVIANEPVKPHIIERTKGYELIAPESMYWEMGNAFSSLLKRKLISLEDAKLAIQIFLSLPLELQQIDVVQSVELASKLGIYAYDAYVLMCAELNGTPLITLDSKLILHAKKLDIQVIKVI